MCCYLKKISAIILLLELKRDDLSDDYKKINNGNCTELSVRWYEIKRVFS